MQRSILLLALAFFLLLIGGASSAWAQADTDLANCKNPQCDPQGSCYACLRSYSNQFQWESLHRNLVADWLTEVLDNARGSRA